MRTSALLTPQERVRLDQISRVLQRPRRTYPPHPPPPPPDLDPSTDQPQQQQQQQQRPPLPVRVRIFTDWCTSTDAMQWLERHCESMLLPHYGLFGLRSRSNSDVAADDANDGLFQTFTLTAGDDFTHAVVVNHAMPPEVRALPPSHVLGITQEPTPFLQVFGDEFRAFAAQHVGRYLVGALENPYRPLDPPLGAPFERSDSHNWYSVPSSGAAPSLATKTHLVSMMISKSGSAPGHVYRHVLAQRILQTHLPVHFFGNGCGRYSVARLPLGHPFYHPATGADARVKGPFTDCDAMLNDYLFHVCIENFSAALGGPVGEYYSEKVLDPLVRETIPVYLGSDAVERAFPNSTVALTGNLEADLNLIANLCHRPLEFLRNVDVAGVKRHSNFLYQLPRLLPLHEKSEK